VPRRFIDIEINCRHELETAKRAVQLAAVRSREDGIAGNSHQGFNLTRACGQNFFRERGDRKFAGEFRQASHPAAPAAETASRGHRLRRRHGIKCRKWKHRAARTIQIPGDNIQDVNQPLTNSAELLCADTDPAVTDGGFGGSKFSRQPANFSGLDACN